MDNWISIQDRLPTEKINHNTYDFEPVLCATTFGKVMVCKYGTPVGWKEPHFWHGYSGKMDQYVTHWMPFPEMPVD